MAGPACKAIINSGVAALTEALERVLTDPNLNGGKIDEGERRKMIQQMADIDRVAMHGGQVEVSLVDIMRRLEAIGVLSADVWEIYTG